MAAYSGIRFNFKRAVVDHVFGIRKLLWPVLDLSDLVHRTLTGRTQYPPLSARQKVGGSIWASIAEFDAIGKECLALLKGITGLQPQHTVLDIGCGCGRLAIPLLEYLQPMARYQGGDVDREMISWCSRSVTPRHPNASFFHIDVFNSFYNPELTKQARDFRFPVQDGSVDRIFLGSVFTHMMPLDVEAYLREMARMLREDGCALISVFVITRARLSGPARPLIEQKFRFAKDGHRLASEKYPELDIAYDEDVLNGMIERSGLQHRQPIIWGHWAGETGMSSHDFLVLEKAK